MSASGLLAQLLNGLASASSLFLVSVGLSLIFGVTRTINFAHGSFYMLGAFIAYSSVDLLSPHIGFWPALLLAPAIRGALGALTAHCFCVASTRRQSCFSCWPRLRWYWSSRCCAVAVGPRGTVRPACHRA